MQDFSELERLMEETNRMPVSDFDKNSLAKLGAEVKKNSVNIETYKDLVKFKKVLKHCYGFLRMFKIKRPQGGQVYDKNKAANNA